ncbi:MAG: sensor histidine kinase [Salinivirgaceae bacterium]|nr:sensor histidine kinase [Salinivirgaceae bacterium]
MKDIAEHILDISQNSISADSTFVEIKIHQSIADNSYTLIIIDNGKGMDKNTVQRVIDPFYTSRTTRKVGLGLPLLKQNAEITGGNFSIQSKVGEGTKVQAEFILDNIDRIPEGDVSGTIVLLVVINPTLDFKFEYATDRGNYIFNTREIKDILGNVPITDNSVRKYLIEMIQENIKEIC